MAVLNFSLSEILAFLLVFARTAGIFTSAPVFGNIHVNIFCRVGMALFLALIFVPMAQTPVDGLPVDALSLAGLIVKEAAVGLMIGFVGMLMFMVIQMAGEMIDLQTGFGLAQILDPQLNIHSSLVSQLHGLAATLLFLTVNAHHMVIRGLAESFNLIPLGGMVLTNAASGSMIELFAGMFVAFMKIGGPVVGVVFLTDVALGILSRTVPQLNIFVLGFPVKIGVGLLAVVVALPMAFMVMTHLFKGLERDILILAGALR